MEYQYFRMNQLPEIVGVIVILEGCFSALIMAIFTTFYGKFHLIPLKSILISSLISIILFVIYFLNYISVKYALNIFFVFFMATIVNFLGWFIGFYKDKKFALYAGIVKEILLIIAFSVSALYLGKPTDSG